MSEDYEAFEATVKDLMDVYKGQLKYATDRMECTKLQGSIEALEALLRVLNED